MRRYTKLKFVFIVGVVTILVVINAQMIGTIWQDQSITRMEAVESIMKQLVGIPQSKKENAPINRKLTKQETVPQVVEESTKNSASYQNAQRVAAEFNQSLDLEKLNTEFNHQTNAIRAEESYTPVGISWYLDEGATRRVSELVEGQYLSSLTIDGEEFRVRYPQILGAQSRLGESTFELHIAYDDVHLKTWQSHPDVLAAYLLKAFDKVQRSEISSGYQTQYIVLKAGPSLQVIDGTPYVRLVAVLTSDIYESENPA